MFITTVYSIASHIVQYKSDASVASDVVIGDFKASFVDIEEGDMSMFLEDEDVKQVKLNGRMYAFGAMSTQNITDLYGLDRIDSRIGLDKFYNYTSSAGKGVTVYVVDTGTQTTHKEFEDRAIWGIDTTGEGLMDNVGHGTFK